MDSSPRRWVLQPLSPQLDQSDLRTLLGSPGFTHDPLLPVSGDEARQVTLSQGEVPSDEFPITSIPSSLSSLSSSSSSPCGFYSFVDDGSLEAELNEVWMLSPQRQTQLATLREGKGFRLQTYSSDRKPSSLFQEEQSLYRVEPGEHVQVVKEHEERQLRTEIIRTQAPKNCLTLKKRWSSLDDVEPSRAPAKLLEGSMLSSCFSDPEGSIDSQQIHFSTARQHFQKMEQDRLNVLLTVPRSPQNTSALHPYQPPSRPLHKQGSAPDLPSALRDPPSAMGPPHLSTTPGDLGQPPVSDYSSDESRSTDSTDERKQTCNLSLETPIEKEMRLAQEREETLRSLRGLKPNRAEMVEIKSKSLFSQLSSSVLKGKERNPVSFLIQREIQRDTQRGGGSQQDNPYLNPNPQQGQPAPPQQGPSPNKDSLRESERWRTLEKHNRARGGEGERGKAQVFPPSCCPHRHTEETELVLWSSAAPAHTPWSNPYPNPKVLSSGFLEDPNHSESLAHITVVNGQTRSSMILKGSAGQGAGRSSSVSVVETPLNMVPPSWRETLGSRTARVSDVIQKDIEENLRREEELREQRVDGTLLSTISLQEPSSSLEPGSTASKLALQSYTTTPPPYTPVVPSSRRA
ncbi:unnamed protein product [Merluccius merluccius]